MSKTVTVALVGICGYGSEYVRQFLDGADGWDTRLVAAVARRPERCKRLDDLKAAGAKIYSDMEAFYADGRADLVVISSPMHLHCAQTCLALSHGSNVLCEKPIAGTIQEARQMGEAEEKAEGFVAIGYQWSFSDAIQDLKRDILAGEFGRPLRLKAFVSWPRNASYYARNDWAGLIKTADGQWILDSPANNATAHYLDNMFYVIGKTRETSAVPVEVQAELYRAKPIKNYDTAAIRCRTEDGVEILFYTSHAIPSRIGPVVCYEFERAVVHYIAKAGSSFTARFKDGRIKAYGDPNATEANRARQCVEAARTGEKVACGIEAATSQILCINGAQDSMPEVVSFPEGVVRETEQPSDDKLVWADGLQAAFLQCYDSGILPSECGDIPWAQEGRIVDLRGYDSFPSR